MVLILTLSLPVQVFAEDRKSNENDLVCFEQNDFISIIEEVLIIRQQNPEYTAE